MFEMILMYVAGTAAGLLAFRGFIKERIIAATLDMLIQEKYLRAWIDDEGITQLYKWYEKDEDRITWEEIESLLEDMKLNEEEYDQMIDDILEDRDEEDDTP